MQGIKIEGISHSLNKPEDTTFPHTVWIWEVQWIYENVCSSLTCICNSAENVLLQISNILLHLTAYTKEEQKESSPKLMGIVNGHSGEKVQLEIMLKSSWKVN